MANIDSICVWKVKTKKMKKGKEGGEKKKMGRRWRNKRLGGRGGR